MTVLSDSDRLDGTVRLINKLFVDANSTANMDTVAIRAAFDAADSWADANSASFNTALPTTFKNTASVTQKSLLLCYVVMKRAGLI